MHEGEQRQPILTWNVQSLSNCFYKQSDTFSVEGAQWRLAASFFKQEDPDLSIQIRLVNNPFDVNKAKEYFNKKEFVVPSNLDEHRVDPVGQFEVEKEEAKDQEQKMEELNNLASDFPNHAFVSFISSIQLDGHPSLSEPVLKSLICSAKAPTTIYT